MLKNYSNNENLLRTNNKAKLQVTARQYINFHEYIHGRKEENDDYI